MFVIVKAKRIYNGASITAVWGPYRTKGEAWNDLLRRAKDFQARRQARFRYETGFRMDTDMREMGGYQLYLMVWKCYGDDERFPPDQEHWYYRVLEVDESQAPGASGELAPPDGVEPAAPPPEAAAAEELHDGC